MSKNNKQVDGIKKIKPGDIKKSRELVLSLIGEATEVENKTTIQPKKIEKKMDGIFFDSSHKSEELKIDFNQIKKSKIKSRDKQKSSSALIASGVLESDNKEKKDNSLKKTILKKKNFKKKEAKIALSSKSKKIVKKKKSVKSKKIRFNLENKSKSKKNKIKKKFKPSLKLSLFSLAKIIKKSFNFSLLIISIFFFLYLSLSFVILNFGKNSALLTAISIRLPVPALISSDGVIYFDAYRKIFNELNVKTDDRSVFNEELARIFIFNKLAKKHQISSKKDLEKVLSFDKEVNIAPFNRIKKIKNTIQNGADFIKIAKKFGDVGQANINMNNFDRFDFGSSIKNIQKNETSDIIITPSGYYIVHCFGRQNGNLSVSYVFIPSLSLDEYLEESSKNYKFWNLTKF